MNRVKIKMLAWGLALAVFMMTGASEPALAQQANIGVFDLQKCLNDSKKGKKARTDLENQAKKMQTDLKAKEAELNKLSGELKKMVENKNSKQADLQKKNEDLQKKVNDFQQQMTKYNEDIRVAEEKAFKPLVDTAVKSAGDLGKAKGYILVLEVSQAGVIYALDTMDLTPDIIKAIDQSR